LSTLDDILLIHKSTEKWPFLSFWATNSVSKTLFRHFSLLNFSFKKLLKVETKQILTHLKSVWCRKSLSHNNLISSGLINKITLIHTRKILENLKFWHDQPRLLFNPYPASLKPRMKRSVCRMFLVN
jgi:hypothetical protein